MQVYNTPVAQVVAIGAEVPTRIVDNDEIAEMVNAPKAIKKILAKLIYRSTRNKTRVYAEEGTAPSDLAVKAAHDAMSRTDLKWSDIDTLIFSSTDMDTLEPATANIVQHKLGIKVINAFDVTNACNSFLQAMNVANSLIATRAAHRVLICSGEVGSYVCNLELEKMSDLAVKMGGLTLGDGGAAMILEGSDGKSGLLEVNLMSMGEHWHLCHVPETTDWRQNGGVIHGWFYLDMPGLAKVAKTLSVTYFSEYNRMRQEMHAEGYFMDSLAQVVPHQISKRFIDDIAGAVKMDMSRICITADQYGNTASTSIPIALQMLIDKGTLTLGSGQDVFLYGAASGFGMGHIRLRM